MAHTAQRAARALKRGGHELVAGRVAAGLDFLAENDEPEPQSRCQRCQVCGGAQIAIEDNGLCRSCRALARTFADAAEGESRHGR